MCCWFSEEAIVADGGAKVEMCLLKRFRSCANQGVRVAN